MAFVCKHGVVCTRPGSEYGYFGWPSAAILGDGRVVVGCSGLRRHHVDPFGKTVLCVGTPKDGFGECIVGHDSPLDDRDAGVVALGAALFTAGHMVPAGHSHIPRRSDEVLPRRV